MVLLNFMFVLFDVFPFLFQVAGIALDLFVITVEDSNQLALRRFYTCLKDSPGTVGWLSSSFYLIGLQRKRSYSAQPDDK